MGRMQPVREALRATLAKTANIVRIAPSKAVRAASASIKMSGLPSLNTRLFVVSDNPTFRDIVGFFKALRILHMVPVMIG